MDCIKSKQVFENCTERIEKAETLEQLRTISIEVKESGISPSKIESVLIKASFKAMNFKY